ncbi:MAG: CapA family protein [Bacteroidetes bacterium]|nr:CapA family protein [Bacteroidota bacterium]
MKFLTLVLTLVTTFSCKAQQEISLLFIGDVMGHDTQIEAAYNAETGEYEYDSVFKYVAPIMRKADYCVANLEVTLAGKPYQGYPQFSSPDELAMALKRAGVDCLVTANNHSCDKHKVGVERTITLLDSFEIAHTGTFKSAEEKAKTEPLIIEQNGFKLALLNYTYGTNGIPPSQPNVVNYIDKDQIAKDLEKAKKVKDIDKIIVFFHWGIQYELAPRKDDEDIAKFCIENGADYIIGAHPHVLQRMEQNGENVIVYSLGNFVSNQRTYPRDGGGMYQLVLKKDESGVSIKESGYYLTWVYPPRIDGKKYFYVLPAQQFENDSTLITSHYKSIMDKWVTDMRALLTKENKGVREYIYDEKKKVWTLKN